MAGPRFPRGTDLPLQSPLFWVHHKDRYIRQLLIQDIEEITKRDLLVYFTDCNSAAQIDQSDDTYLVELLGQRQHSGADLFLETNGGWTDATEKVVSILRNLAPDIRVIVPRRAKSNGTVVALCGSEIIMGANSELGPIDPFVQNVPAEFIIQAAAQLDPVLVQAAKMNMSQTKKLAKDVLSSGMLKGSDPQKIADIVDKLSSRVHYHSHGSVIDCEEANSLGLKATYLPPTNDLWQRLWLLRTVYDFDARQAGLSKIFEGAKISSSIALQKSPPNS